MLGYWNNEEETNKVLKDGWLYTGDIGEFDGDYLKMGFQVKANNLLYKDKARKVL